jgi:tetratricopeptide (TPR) repeat protein
MDLICPWMTTMALAVQLGTQTGVGTNPSEAPDSLLADPSRFASLESAALEPPLDYRRLWETARTGATTAAALGDSDEGRAMLLGARRLANAAVELRPDGVGGHYWLAVSAGLLADVNGGRSKIRFAEEAWRESERVLALDSLHAGAHHIQGRLHAGVMRLSWLTRTLAVHLLGADLLGEASWDEAVRHLRLAAELAPEEAVYHLELGVAYRDLGREEEAKRAFEAAMAAPTLRPADDAYKARARRLLGESSGAGQQR